ERATQTVRLDVDGVTVTDTTVSLGPGESTTWEADLPAGDRVDAFLEGEDLLDADDHAYAVTSRRRELRILVAGVEDPYLERALAVIPGITVDRTDTSTPASGYDLAIYTGVRVPAEPG